MSIELPPQLNRFYYYWYTHAKLPSYFIKLLILAHHPHQTDTFCRQLLLVIYMYNTILFAIKEGTTPELKIHSYITLLLIFPTRIFLDKKSAPLPPSVKILI